MQSRNLVEVDRPITLLLGLCNNIRLVCLFDSAALTLECSQERGPLRLNFLDSKRHDAMQCYRCAIQTHIEQTCK